MFDVGPCFAPSPGHGSRGGRAGSRADNPKTQNSRERGLLGEGGGSLFWLESLGGRDKPCGGPNVKVSVELILNDSDSGVREDPLAHCPRTGNIRNEERAAKGGRARARRAGRAGREGLHRGSVR